MLKSTLGILGIFVVYGNVLAQLDYGYGPNDAPSVTIGLQTWMVKNLNVEKFANGDTIPQAKTAREWSDASDNHRPVWCYYDNDSLNGRTYGKLYNWFTVNDPRGLAPIGWHISTDAEWTELTYTLGGESKAGFKMKSISGWQSTINNGNGENSSGFTGLPGGARVNDGVFNTIGKIGIWWTFLEDYKMKAWSRCLVGHLNLVCKESDYKGFGHSVRCVKD